MKTTLVLMVITSMMTVLCAVDTSKPFDLTTTLGEKYKNCRISKVTPEGLTIVHEGGVARLSFEVLGEELKQQFRYDPVKAQGFAAAEQAKQKAAETKRAELNRKREHSEEDQLAELAAAERKRLEADARATKEYHDAIKAAQTPPAPLAPLPGDATPALSQTTSQPIMQTEVVVPTLTPVGDPYTPTKIRSQTYVYPGGYYGGGYMPYGYGYGYGGYYQPVYGHPGHGHSHCPPGVPYSTPGVSGTISTGGMILHFSR